VTKSERRSPLVIAHRGASADHPENTVAAFAGARGQGADWVELDVRVAADGALVVHHDPTYPDGRDVIAVAAPDRPAHVPMLDAALDACSGMGVNVEIKNSPGDLGVAPAAWGTDVADAVVALLAGRAAAGRDGEVLVSCFDWTTLQRVRELDPSMPTAFLVFDLAADPQAPERSAEAGHVALHPWDPFVDEALVARCHGVGVAVNTWTVDDPLRITELARLGVDGIVTNVPAVARRVLRDV
jgi:glycerophosphoryl diester phosphodiesterase